MKDHFWEVADKLPLRTHPLLESTNKEVNHHYLTLFDDHTEGEGIVITPFKEQGRRGNYHRWT